MTYDPYRPRDPYENPYRVNEPDRETGIGAAFLLGALLLAALGGYIYYGAGDRATVASNALQPPITQPNQPVRPAPPETTGAGSANAEPDGRPLEIR